MRDVDYVGERGMGAWIRARREKLGFSRITLAQAAATSEKTIERYELDEGIGYTTLRILDSLGVRWSAGPLKDAPASVNRELRDLRLALEARGAVEPAGWVEDLDRRLQSIADKAEQDAAATAASLLALQAAIERIEQRLQDGEADGHQAAQ